MRRRRRHTEEERHGGGGILLGDARLILAMEQQMYDGALPKLTCHVAMNIAARGRAEWLPEEF